MTDLPILFNAPIVRALLEGRKTQTRRTMKAPKWSTGAADMELGDDGLYAIAKATGCLARARPSYAVGDRLWVREAWHAARSLDKTPPRDIPRDADIEHAATARGYAEIGLKGKLRPGMFMCRWMSRLTLTVTDVRVERLQDISEADAQAEGVFVPDAQYAQQGPHAAVLAYAALWDSINGPGSWDANPWVAAYTFTIQHGNIDQFAEAAHGRSPTASPPTARCASAPGGQNDD